MLDREWVGKRVRLTRDVAAAGGTRYHAGSVWVVEGSWRGQFRLRRWGSAKGYLSGVPRFAFEAYAPPSRQS